MKKIFLAVLCMILLPAYSAFAEEPTEAPKYGKSEGFSYAIEDDGTAEITSTSNTGDIVIPATLDGHTVTKIRARAFERKDKIVSVTIQEGVLEIGDGAFYWCEDLKEVTLPSTIEKIGVNPFDVCEGLKSIRFSAKNPNFEVKDGVLFDKNEKRLITYLRSKRAGSYKVPEGTLHIGDSAFSGNEYLQTVSFPKSLLTIGKNAFHTCYKMKGALKLPTNLESVGEGAFALCMKMSSLTIPASLKEIGPKAFLGAQFKTITISNENTAFQMKDGVLFTADGKTLVLYPGTLSGESYTVPKGTEELLAGSFYSVQNLQSLIVSEGVTTIGDLVCYVCPKLAEVRLPASVTSIGKSSIEGCDDDVPFVVTVPADSFAETWAKTKTYVRNGDYYYHLDYKVE